MIKVKICGITNLIDAAAAEKAGADALGFIFTKKSPRFIAPEKAKAIISKLDPFVVKAGVFLDQPKSEVLRMARLAGVDILQFHGSETPSYCKSFVKEFKIIKVIFSDNRPLKKKLAGYKADAFLFDISPSDKAKGLKVLPDKILKEISVLAKAGKWVIISGGLTPENVGRVSRFKPFAVDVARGVELKPGKKDSVKIRSFIAATKR
jgi:phosphoribosylanthranilate isomerase